ncbi:hypothetical protein DRQ25_05265 [Candidatus Fermentibacteria bacterium]|nr:MAG: hypothetical protein DRQ25_05265 [Candidatus Fermentibacteria bacterium]
MDEEQYIVIRTTEDGIYIDAWDKETLLSEMNEDGWDEDNFCQVVPSASDPNYWGTSTVVIKGKVVVPKKVAVSIRYDME